MTTPLSLLLELPGAVSGQDASGGSPVSADLSGANAGDHGTDGGADGCAWGDGVGADPDALVPAHYGRPAQEQWALAAGDAVTELGGVAVLAVRGADRLTWLHNITTQHLNELAPGVPTELLVLDPNGRIQHGALVVDDGEATWLLAESAPAERAAGRTLADFLDSMRFALRVEVERHDELTVLAVISGGRADAALTEVLGQVRQAGRPVEADSGISAGEIFPAGGGAPVAGIGSGVTWVDPWPQCAEQSTTYGPTSDHPGEERPVTVHAVPRARVREVVDALAERGVSAAGALAFEALRVAAWRPRVACEADEKAIPHEADWLRTAIHLHKGCYRGQETVARVVNLGRPPRRLVQLHLDGSVEILPQRGDAVLLGSRQVGAVTSVARHAVDGPIALAYVRRATDPSAALRVASGEHLVDATQIEIVVASGEPADRPAQPDRSALMRRDLRRP